MKFYTQSPLVVLCLFFTLITLFSCSKDSDLMADYVALDPEVLIGKYVRSDTFQISIISNSEDDTYEITVNSGENTGNSSTGNAASGGTVNDTYQTSSSASIVLDVLANDTFNDLDNVSISEISQPVNGEVVINSDNTLTYTPFTVEATENSFTYTVEFVKEDGTIGKETGTVTVIINQDPNDMGGLKAFPSSFGGGSNASGGRGGIVLHVTNLNASGAGSFRAALETAGPAYIVFDVSGVITTPLDGWTLNNISDKTILGQTAPEGGITITGGKMRFNNASNVIIRYIRSRPILNRYGVLNTEDDAWTTAFVFHGSENIILDHVSASFSQDKVINFFGNDGRTTKNITVSHCLISDGGTMVTFGVNPGHDIGQVDDISFIYNLIGNTAHRTPNFGYNGYGEILNNVVHTPNYRMTNIYYDLKLNHIGNYYKKWGGAVVTNKHQNVGGVGVYPVIYTKENFYTGVLNGTISEDNSIIWKDFGDNSQLGASFFTNTLHNRTVPNPSPILTPQNAYDKVIADVGANKYIDDNGYVQTYIDDYDQSVISNVINNIRVEPKNPTNWVLPTLPNNTRPTTGYDDDDDGMADAWEIRTFGNLNKSYNDDFDSEGYTVIEAFAYQTDIN